MDNQSDNTMTNDKRIDFGSNIINTRFKSDI